MRSEAAYSRSDILALLAIVFLLSFLAVPALCTSRRVVSTAVCQSNMRSLLQAWQLYSDQYNGQFVSNYFGTVPNVDRPQAVFWAGGFLDWSTSAGNTNINLLLNPKAALLAPYLEPSQRNIHKCTADIYLSPAQRSRRFKQRVRSVSMNITVGYGKTSQGPADFIYAYAGSHSDLIFPGPERSTVFLEVHPDSIFSALLLPPESSRWVDVPSGLHGNAGMVSFADGRAELRRWRSSLLNRRVRYLDRTSVTTRIGDPDLSWLSFHSNRRTSRSY